MIELQGGNDNFIHRLDFIFNNVSANLAFSHPFTDLNVRLQSYFDSTDEPSQQIPFMYHYANRPGLSTQRSRQVIAEFYNTSTNGLPGNDGGSSVF